VLALSLISARSAESPATNAPAWLSRPLSLPEALEIVLRQNPNIVRGKSDIEAAYGVVLQTRAVVLPRVRSTGNFTANDPGSIETFPTPIPVHLPNQNWTINVQLIQSIYEGGRLNSALRSARLTKDQALAQYEAVVADTVLEVEVAYYDVLVTGQLIVVQEASVNLLLKELSDTRNRFEAGTVPQFNVLRAEVEVANARPRLIRAKNANRIAKNNLATLLGFDVPKEVWEDIPLQLSDKLEAQPMSIQLPTALGQALQRRPELVVLRKSEGLRREQIVNAKAGYKPSVQAFAGYGARNSSFFDDLSREVHGWNTGIQFSWDIFDGLLTKGRVQQAEALLQRARVDVSDTARRIEQEVRTAYSTFVEAQEVLESQKKVQEQAEEALRLAVARNEAGAGTQLDVLSAQTALTEARSTQVQALRDYEVARARLQRAIGENITIKK
jgi:outer membrane protein TolC